MKWKNIHNIEMEVFLNAILKDFDSFKAKVENTKMILNLKLIMFPQCRPLNA